MRFNLKLGTLENKRLHVRLDGTNDAQNLYVETTTLTDYFSIFLIFGHTSAALHTFFTIGFKI
jgi:hypothetical protein